MTSTTPLWTPSAERIAQAPITEFMARAAQISGRAIDDFDTLHKWSVEDREAFWPLVWD